MFMIRSFFTKPVYIETVWHNVNRFHTMGDKTEKKIIAVCQMTATNDIKENFNTVKHLVKSAKENKAQMVFLPEACDYISDTSADTVGMASPLDGQIVMDYCTLAKDHQIWLSLGGIHEKIPNSLKIFNSHVIINDQGSIVAVYRKVHLYDVNIPEKKIVIQESAMAEWGSEIVAPVISPVGKVGLEICYDLRFPELSLVLAKMGAEILTFPSAFMRKTGEAHWEPLLRARAVECQCYVVAAAQTGQHNAKRASWGHAMVVDPWGRVIAECADNTTIAFAEIDLSYLQDIREQMPLWQQRRNDVYPALIPVEVKPNLDPTMKDVYQFGQTTVKANIIFYKTKSTIAFTNLRCVLPGHVLVSPIRCVPKLSDLTAEEVSDLFLCVQKVQRVMERVQKVCSSTIAIQDGEHAGQTIQHVHVHLLPRRLGDFAENDHIYHELQNHDKHNRSIRSEKEMMEEAALIRTYF